MKVHIKGRGTVELNKNDFLAEGGQGKIFAKGGTVYKVYHDHTKMIPEAKIGELSNITLPNVIRPLETLLDTKNRVIGYTMRHVADTWVLCQMFTKAFRQRERVTEETILRLVKKFATTVKHIHSKGCLIVDLNEMNELVAKDFSDIYLIDTDSWKTKSFGATALMESVRDRHAKFDNKVYEANEGTDWFSFAVVTFQMFVGIHPYKGKHPGFVGDLATTMDERMKRNVSVFDKDVAIPAVCYPLTSIPTAYRAWYEAVFQKGFRGLPPDDATAVLIISQVHRVSGSDNFDMDELHVFDENIIDYHFSGSNEVVVTEGAVYVNNRKTKFAGKNPAIGFTPKMNHPIAATVSGGYLKLYDLMINGEISTDISAQAMMSYNGRIYYQWSDHIMEVQFIESGVDTIPAVRVVANCMEQATQMFPGVAIQSLLGSYYLSFFPSPGNSYQLRMKELDGHRIIDAEFKNGVLMVVAIHGGKYHRFVVRIDSTFTAYDMRKVSDITYAGLNFTVLDSGLAICITEEDKMEVFAAAKDSTSMKVIDDPAVNSSMFLFNRGTTVIVGRERRLIRMSMKKKK